MGPKLFGLGCITIDELIHYGERPSPLGRQPPLFIGLNRVLFPFDFHLFLEGLCPAVSQMNPTIQLL